MFALPYNAGTWLTQLKKISGQKNFQRKQKIPHIFSKKRLFWFERNDHLAHQKTTQFIIIVKKSNFRNRNFL